MRTAQSLALFAVLIGTGATAEELLVVDDPRPVAAAVRVLEERYGWLINYEDPKYEMKDVVDRTSPSYRGQKRALDPRGGRLEIRYPVSESTRQPISEPAVLEMVINENSRRGNPGDFVLRRLGTGYSVGPRQGSILDVKITIPHEERTYEAAVREIVAAVSRETGVPVGGPAMFRPRKERYLIGAKAESARDVLLRLFSQVEGYELRWHILYSPGWGYVVNIDGVKLPSPIDSPRRYTVKEVILPDGSKGTIPVRIRPE